MSSTFVAPRPALPNRYRFVPNLRVWWSDREALSPLVWLTAAGLLVLHLVTAGRYGVFRDELYYLACADHLAWGYVDHPPLSIAVLAAWRALFGESILALRILPALAGAALVVLTAVLARALGGTRPAQNLAALGVATAPGIAAMSGFYSMNAFDLLFWVLAFLAVTRLAREGEPKGWLVFGLVVGIGLLNKLSVGFLAVAVAAAKLASPLRRHLRTPYPWLGALLAAVLFAPHVAWQTVHDWPTAEFVANATRHKIAAQGIAEWSADFALGLGPLSILLWVPGAVWLLAARAARPYRILGFAAIGVVAWIALQGGKTYYARPVAPLLFAAGGIAIERLTSSRRWIPLAVGSAVAVSNAFLLPLAVPVLEPETLVAYQTRLGIEPGSSETHELALLPQHFADRFGWPELAAAVAQVWHALPEEEQQGAVIVTANYGEAGALRRFGPAHHLPPAASQHNNYYLWGPGRPLEEIETVIAVGIPPEALAGSFAEVESAGTVQHPWAMPYETGEILWIARRPTRPLEAAWREGKHFI